MSRIYDVTSTLCCRAVMARSPGIETRKMAPSVSISQHPLSTPLPRYNLRSRTSSGELRTPQSPSHPVPAHVVGKPTTTSSLDDISYVIGERGTSVPNQKFETAYQKMLYDKYNMPMSQSLLAAFFAWIMLAGFLVFPITFTNYARKQAADTAYHNATYTYDNKTGNVSFDPGYNATQLKNLADNTERVQNTDLLVVAAVCTISALLGQVWLWRRHRMNYLWLNENIFFPCLDKAALGLFSTVISQVTGIPQQGKVSPSAIATLVVTSLLTVGMSVGFLYYNFVRLSKIKEVHDAVLGNERQVNALVQGVAFVGMHMERMFRRVGIGARQLYRRAVGTS